MFIFFIIIIFIFGFLLGIFFLGSHILSFWFNIVFCILFTLIIIFYLFTIAVCLYGYCFYDFCLILIFDFFTIQMSFFCNGFYFFILFFINIIFLFIYFYAFYYMFFDVFLHSFFNILWWFVLCMNLFLLSFDLLTIYLAWELLGLFSYFLISYFWFSFFALNFAFNAFFISNIGDVFLLTSIVLIIFSCGYSSISLYFINFFCVDYYNSLYFLIFILMCSFTNSTQFGLHIWLPDAMEGPIPVSALIHAATLVVCGIILLCYIYFILEFWLNHIYIFLMWSSVISLFMTSSIIFNFDINSYIAFSTICQISFSLFCTVCIDIYIGCMLFCYHMFYNATLFIVLGVWIHFFYGVQDISAFNFVYFFSCVLMNTIIIFAIFNSCSMWFLCGFYCNDLMLITSLSYSYNFFSEFFIIIIFFICFTLIYNYFLLFYLCFSFNCFCMTDSLFLIFDFECCLIYCSISLILCIYMVFFFQDFVYFFVYSSSLSLFNFYLYSFDFFDIAVFIILLILLLSLCEYGSILIFLLSADCIMFFWKFFNIFSILFVYFSFSTWNLINFYIYSIIFSWSFVINLSYNLNYCFFFCLLILFYF